MKKICNTLCFVISFVILLTAASFPEPHITHDIPGTAISEEAVQEEASLTEKAEDISEEKKEEETALTEPEISELTLKSEEREVYNENKPEEDGPYYNYTPGGNHEQEFELSWGEYEGELTNRKYIHTYKFRVYEKERIQYRLSHKALTDGSGFSACLYQEYYVNGTEGETAWRLLNVTESRYNVSRALSVPLGLIPGNYRIVIREKGRMPEVPYILEKTELNEENFETECNDNIYRYNELFDSVSMHGSSSYLPDKSDRDYYMFRIYEKGFSEISFTHSKGEGVSAAWIINLFGEDGKILYSDISSLSDEGVTSGALGLVPGNYYVEVISRVYTNIPYVIKFKRTETSGFETEFNDSRETADEIKAGEKISGSLTVRRNQKNGTDVDYFYFDAPASGYAEITFTHKVPDEEREQGWYIEFSDSEGHILSSRHSLLDAESFTLPVTGIDKGRYFIAVKNENLTHSKAIYETELKFTETGSYETEFNNSIDRADGIAENQILYGSIAEYGTEYDSDCFALYNSKKGRIKIRLDYKKDDRQENIFTLTLYDGTGYRIKSFNCNSSEDAVLDTGVLAPGRYIIKVTNGVIYSSQIYALSWQAE